MPLISGKKILDLSRIIAGPYATMVLSDFGCSVIKVEPPEGDASRMWGPPWVEK
jgi:formyl-CoA transferase